MSGYIKVRKDLVDDPRLLELAEQYEDYLIQRLDPQDLNGDAIGDASRHALVGALVTLWCYADTHIRDDNTLPLKVTALARVMRLPAEILKKFPAEWVVIQPGGTILLPGYREKNGIISREKRKELARERTQRWRDRLSSRDADRDASRTRSLHAAYPSPSPTPSEGSLRSSSVGDLSPSSSERAPRTANKADENRRKVAALAAGAVRRMPA